MSDEIKITIEKGMEMITGIDEALNTLHGIDSGNLDYDFVLLIKK